MEEPEEDDGGASHRRTAGVDEGQGASHAGDPGEGEDGADPGDRRRRRERWPRRAPKIRPAVPAGLARPGDLPAKPEIWQKWPEFEGYAKSLEAKANALAATARTGDAQATAAAVTELGKTTCGACHNAFRGPEIKK